MYYHIHILGGGAGGGRSKRKNMFSGVFTDAIFREES